MSSIVAQLDNVIKDYSMGEVTYRALHGVSLKIASDDFAVIVGPSGAGKSTVLHILGAIDFPTEGGSLLNNKDTISMNDNELSRFRLNHLGFIFQEFNLVEVLTVYENVEYPLSINDISEKETKEKVEWILNEVGLYRYRDHKSTELSGGQRQRVAIARALVNSPDLVLADEPTAALDSKTGQEILDLMQKMNEEKIAAFLFATHDPEVMKYAKRKIKIKDGLLVGDEK